MKKTSTITGVAFKKYLVFFLTILSFTFTQSVLGHSVDSYSGTCASGPQYKVTAVVSNVNNTSNYRWQWKNSAGAWICFVNGNNTINGNTYNVTGAVYNLTTTPGPIVFTNPNSGLQGLQIRMVISDGNGVNPCTLPSGNTWTSANPHVININNTPCAASGSIGDRVWWDGNNNGLQDASETGGISGVTVQLRNSANTVIATQTTNASGNYLFTGLSAGTYTVVFPLTVTGGVLTTANVGTNDNIDSDPSTTTGITANIVLAANQSNLTVDAGYKPTNLKLGNRVWYDTDNDGLNDAAENGIRNVTVKLYTDNNNDNVADGASIATVVTDVNGNYTFSNLSPGNYIVGAVTPNGYMSSSVNGGDPDNNTDLDDNGQVVAGTEIRGLAITLTGGAEPTSGNTNNTYDFGFLPDCNCNTSSNNQLVNGSFENGTTGWNWNSANGSLTTGTGYVACGSANGFNNQSSGTSKVWQDVAATAGATVTFKGFAGTHTAGIGCSPKLSLIFLNAANTVLGQSDVLVTRDVDINNGQLEQYSITAVAPVGTTKVRVQSTITCNTMKIDAFCLNISATCTGAGTWNLSMPNGTMGTSHAYTVNGVTITAYGFNNGNPGTPTALYGKNAGGDETGLGIASNSDFEIDANHFVQLDLNQVIAAGITSGTMSIGSMQAGEPAGVYGSNTLGVRGTLLMTVPVSLNNTSFPMPGLPTYRYISVNAAAATPANVLLQQVSFSCPTNTGKIGDFVWQDMNRNGIQDSGEPGIGGVTVTLSGAATATTTTAADGSYHFNNLAAGTYNVTFATPASSGNPFVATTANAGVNDAVDSDPVGGVVTGIVLAAGETKNTIDAGFYRQINITGNVWNDANGLTDLQINRTGTQAIPNSLNIYLVDVNTNLIVQAESILPDGTYSFADVEINTSYKIVLTTVVAFPGQPSPTPFLPSGWQRVGENLGAGPLSGSDGVPNGLLFVDTETSDIDNANFGIRVNSGEVVIG
jgi:hypothetical protein